MAVDPAHPFPYISGLSLNLALVMRNPATGKEHFARVKVPPIINRWMPADAGRFVPLEEVIAAHLDLLFPGMEAVAHHAFRVTRNEDLEVEEDDAENLLKALEKELLRRKFGPPVRLEVEESIDPDVLDTLASELGVKPDEVVRLRGPLDLRSLNEIADIDRPELRFDPFVPGTHQHLAEVETASPADLFSALSKRDVLVHHPYDSFATSVQRFIEQAAADPNVLAIKQTLYRTSGDSPIIDSLVDAARSGKQVLVLVEIKARFDEQANIRWARKLERAGCHVVYGLVGLKTHCKLALVVREEPDGLRRYAHIGTGNYNPKTARLYEDFGLLTADPTITSDLTHLFNNLSGFAQDFDYDRLMVAPAGLRSQLVDHIDAEIAHHRAGRPSGIRIKVNSIVDEKIIDKLYEASTAGVQIDLIVRGICTLRPGVPGLSDNIRVSSVLGRFLEHSRAYWFACGGEPQAWIGSADLMHRNLDRRVEVLVRIPEQHHIDQIGDLLETMADDGTSSWRLGSRRRLGPRQRHPRHPVPAHRASQGPPLPLSRSPGSEASEPQPTSSRGIRLGRSFLAPSQLGRKRPPWRAGPFARERSDREGEATEGEARGRDGKPTLLGFASTGPHATAVADEHALSTVRPPLHLLLTQECVVDPVRTPRNTPRSPAGAASCTPDRHLFRADRIGAARRGCFRCRTCRHRKEDVHECHVDHRH